MQVAILGPLQVHAAGREIPISGTRLRRLLVRLAVEAGRPVSTAALADAIWPDAPPVEAPNALQALVSRLRRALGDPEAIAPTPGGYRIALADGDLDADAFARLARQGRRLLDAGDAASAEPALSAALRLWRGEPLIDADGADFAVPLVGLWSEVRLEAAADRIDALLRLGRSAEVLAELEGLVAAHPLRERFVGQLMTVYATAGRTADAFARYESLRRRLADELGVDPGAAVAAVHLALLRGEIGSPPAARPPTLRRTTNLRAELSSFLGRDAELSRVAGCSRPVG